MWTILVLGILYGGVLALIAAGLTLIFGVMNVVNFAHGDFVMVAMVATAVVTTQLAISPYITGLVVLAAAVPVLMAIYFLVMRPIIGRNLYVHVFATIGLSLVLQAAARMVWGPGIRSVHHSWSSHRVIVLGATVETGRIVAFVIAALMTAALWLALRYSHIGLEMRAVADNPKAARTIGIRIPRARLTAFLVSGLLAVAAGVLIVPFTPVKPTTGMTLTLISFVIVVLGSLGSLPGALLGGLIVGIIHTATGYYIGTNWPMIALFIIFVATLLLRPQGIAHRRTRESTFGQVRI